MPETNEETTDITTRGGVRLRVTVWTAPGAAPPTRDLLLLHGWPSAGRTWRDFAEAVLLADPAFRLLALDFRGYGDSDASPAGYTCAQFADDTQDAAAALGLSSYALFGHSMGGKIPQLVTARQPAGLTALVLVTPGLLAASPPVNIAARRAMQGNAAQTRALVTGFAARKLPGEAADTLTADALRVSPVAWNGWLDLMRGEDFAAEAARIAVPTLVVGGGKDPQRSETELQSGVVSPITGAQYARLPGSGHLPHLEEPDALAAIVVNFLDASLPATTTDKTP